MVTTQGIIGRRYGAAVPTSTSLAARAEVLSPLLELPCIAMAEGYLKRVKPSVRTRRAARRPGLS